MNEIEQTTGASALVGADWLEKHLDDSNLRILECTVYLDSNAQPPVIESGYPDWVQGHIPGSSFVDLIREISDTNARVPFTLPSPAQFADAMSRHGVGEGKRVILYDRGKTLYAARVWWMLRYFGYETAAVLNGGWTRWVAEGRLVSQDVVRFPFGKFEPRINPGWFVGKEEVLSALRNHRYRVIYALEPAKYEGRKIPGSQMVTAEKLLDPETELFLPLEVVRQRFSEVNALDQAHVITYCGSGIAASLDAFALHLLGKEDVSVYDGSLLEWMSDESLPQDRW